MTKVMATRIVICDDHPVFRGGLVTAFDEEADFDVVAQVGSIADLREALAGSGEVDLVLLDVDLPDGSAVDSVPELVELAPVVMISAHDSPPLVRAALAGGALGYIRKDAEPTELLRLVRKAADGKTALSSEMAVRVAESLRRDPDEAVFEQTIAALPPRQREVVALIAEGRTNREIADELCISEGTVKNYVTRILDAAGVADRTKLAILLVRHQMR